MYSDEYYFKEISGSILVKYVDSREKKDCFVDRFDKFYDSTIHSKGMRSISTAIVFSANKVVCLSY